MPHIPDMKEKTLRYPGHIALVTALQRSGFFDEQPVEFKGAQVVPRDFSSQILFKQWKLQPNEPEFTIMRIVVEGERGGQRKRVTYNLLDRYDPATQISSMARTTGYTCTAAVHLLSKGLFSEIGVFPPELVGRHEACFDFVLAYLSERGVVYRREEIG
jgi:saccharopine dehydrogenase-like NADP-dependent oxidoreductase